MCFPRIGEKLRRWKKYNREIEYSLLCCVAREDDSSLHSMLDSALSNHDKIILPVRPLEVKHMLVLLTLFASEHHIAKERFLCILLAKVGQLH